MEQVGPIRDCLNPPVHEIGNRRLPQITREDFVFDECGVCLKERTAIKAEETGPDFVGVVSKTFMQ